MLRNDVHPLPETSRQPKRLKRRALMERKLEVTVTYRVHERQKVGCMNPESDKYFSIRKSAVAKIRKTTYFFPDTN